ncbi:hypothetical protein bcgnr5387_40350 [Bacillus luti]|nr:hypothetical protein BC2903_29110 [Bacillus cereus]
MLITPKKQKPHFMRSEVFSLIYKFVSVSLTFHHSAVAFNTSISSTKSKNTSKPSINSGVISP